MINGERGAAVERRTHETEIQLTLNLDGQGQAEVDTGIGFLDHMLTLFAAHGLFDLAVQAKGDLHVDEHHTTEDVAICLGQALHQALGDRAGIVRTAHAFVPMDETLAFVAVDLSGRPYTVFQAEWHMPRIGNLDTDLIHHFFETLAVHGRFNLHARILCGRNDHHQAEALFKALGRALEAASRPQSRRVGIPSTKGTLTA
ncbi:MAG TPA: imidazoleglycerol-phosphate dehydratase HisB [Anaerolineae bacterium]|nr:imidazoleglycerol-phosphate dehydratase HisB [Anaerolineae bacterium]HIQ05712.1 imidazoleglycerol-phosphate dehydratase HisB [Anaerolineae bacterium]